MKEKLKFFGEKLKRTVLLEDDDILWRSEIEGNRLTTNVQIFFAILLIGTFFATKAGLFVIDMKYMVPVTVLGLIELFIPFFICNGFSVL